MLVAVDGKSPTGLKESKKTMSLCLHAAGIHKCKLMVIGKSLCPGAFKGVKIFPIIYLADNQDWVTSNITLDWFENLCV